MNDGPSFPVDLCSVHTHTSFVDAFTLSVSVPVHWSQGDQTSHMQHHVCLGCASTCADISGCVSPFRDGARAGVDEALTRRIGWSAVAITVSVVKACRAGDGPCR